MLNLHVSKVLGQEYKVSTDGARATWLGLLAYCAVDENGGRIRDCRSWGRDIWLQVAAVSVREIHSESELWTWDGDDLIVWGYPIEHEEAAKEKREANRLQRKRRRERDLALAQSGSDPAAI